MKQRTFWTTFLLFLVFFNIGIVIISLITFTDNYNVIKERCVREQYLIASSLIRDFSAIESRDAEIDTNLSSIAQSYLYLVDNKNVGFALYKNTEQVYNAMQGLGKSLTEYTPLESENNARSVMVHKENNSAILVISGQLPSPYNIYTLSYFYDLSDTINDWTKMKNSLFLICSVFSVLLAVCLVLILNKIFKPLKQISEVSKCIASGEYEKRISVSGNDELSEMGNSFNNMADEIQRQIAELDLSSNQKQQFIDNFAHELRTPLTAIFGYAELIQKTAISDEDKLFATGYIMSESQRLQKLAHQLLELATMNVDGICFEEIKVSELFESVHSTLFEKALSKHIDITYINEFDTLNGERNLLKSLLINIIENAMKACASNGKIEIKAYFDDNKKILSVTDNGKGMSATEISHSSEPFYRADKARTRKEGGAGLGLSICAQIVKLHKAEFEISSSKENGTKITITFTTP